MCLMLLAVIINCFADVFAYKIVVCNHKFIPLLSKQYYRAHVTRGGRDEGAGRAVGTANSEFLRISNRTKPEGVTAILHTIDKIKYREFSVVNANIISGA